MSERTIKSGNGSLRRWRRWVAGLSRAQRIRLRFVEVLLALAVLFALLLTLYTAVIRPPKLYQRPELMDAAEFEWGGRAADFGERRTDAYTILLVGKDTGGGGNTDTVILACFDTKQKTLNAMSLPRDTMVNVSWRTKKLNTIYNYYKGKEKETQTAKGIAALKAHVGKLTGILPDFHILVEWDAVGELVDTLGGVTFDVPYDMNYDDPAQDLHIHQAKGERLLSGSDAMQVIRWRKNNGKYGRFQIGDSGRMKVQQEFLIAVAKECLKAKNVTNIPKFADIFAEKVDTDLTVGNLIWFGQQAAGMDAEKDIRFVTMPYTNYAGGTAYVLPVVDEMLAILNDGFNPYKEQITRQDLEVLVLQKNGAFTVTSGTLADPSLGQKSKSKSKTTPTAPVQMPEPQKPDAPPDEPAIPEPELPEVIEQEPVDPGFSGGAELPAATRESEELESEAEKNDDAV